MSGFDMDRQERIEHLTEQVQDTVIRLSREYDIKVAEMVGVEGSHIPCDADITETGHYIVTDYEDSFVEKGV